MAEKDFASEMEFGLTAEFSLSEKPTKERGDGLRGGEAVGLLINFLVREFSGL